MFDSADCFELMIRKNTLTFLGEYIIKSIFMKSWYQMFKIQSLPSSAPSVSSIKYQLHVEAPEVKQTTWPILILKREK